MEFLEANWLRPHNSAITGEMIIRLRDEYKIPILATLVILGKETSLGDPVMGGELARKNNFGCIKATTRGPWEETANGTTVIRGTQWWTWPDARTGMDAWGWYLSTRFDGAYLKWIAEGDWQAFCERYHGLVAGIEAHTIDVLHRVANIRARAAREGFEW